jgi:hypothetical protein
VGQHHRNRSDCSRRGRWNCCRRARRRDGWINARRDGWTSRSRKPWLRWQSRWGTGHGTRYVGSWHVLFGSRESRRQHVRFDGGRTVRRTLRQFFH